MNKLILIPIMLIVLSMSVYAECQQHDKIKDRFLDRCKDENGVCEDGENLLDNDCELSEEALMCKGDRCIFTEMWFAKLLIFLFVGMALSGNRKYNLFIIVIMIFLIFNFMNGFEMMGSDSVVSPPETEYTDAALKSNIVLLVGSYIFPSHPTAGFFIGLIILYLLIIRGSRAYRRIK